MVDMLPRVTVAGIQFDYWHYYHINSFSLTVKIDRASVFHKYVKCDLEIGNNKTKRQKIDFKKSIKVRHLSADVLPDA